jgi:hypothetical protein
MEILNSTVRRWVHFCPSAHSHRPFAHKIPRSRSDIGAPALLRALETFQSLGIEFVSLTEGVDTWTPMGEMVFTVLGAVAELERSLIVERVKAGLRNARAKGKRLGRPRVVVDATRIAAGTKI